MPGRVRSLNYGVYTGTIRYIHGGGDDPESVSLGGVTTGDIVGDYGQPHPFTLERFKLNPGTITGQAEVFPVYHFTGYPYANQSSAGVHLAGSPISDVEAATNVIAATNPSRAEVSVPNFIAELKDLPSMLHLKGQSHHSKRRSQSVVEQNFGWDLLFRDLASIFDFTGQVDRRVKESNNLHAKGGLRRMRTTYDGGGSEVDENVYFHSFEFVVRGHVNKQTRCKQWVTVRWLPDAVDIPDAADMLALARRTVHGWSLDSNAIASVIWEAVPWSWFSDYFSNVGTFLRASNNSVGATPICCVMTHVRTEHTQVVEFVPPGISCSPSSSILESKQRVLQSAGITATQPFLTTKQLLTLSSIAVSLGTK